MFLSGASFESPVGGAFEMRYADTKAFLAALEQHEKASHKLAKAMHQVTHALDAYTSSLRSLVDSREIDSGVKQLLGTAEGQMRDFQLSTSYLDLTNWQQDLPRTTGALRSTGDRLRQLGKARKEAKETFDKCEAKHMKRPNEAKVQRSLSESTEALTAKDCNFTAHYKNVCHYREEAVPAMLAKYLETTERFFYGLESTLADTRALAAATIASSTLARNGSSLAPSFTGPSIPVNDPPPAFTQVQHSPARPRVGAADRGGGWEERPNGVPPTSRPHASSPSLPVRRGFTGGRQPPHTASSAAPNTPASRVQGIPLEQLDAELYGTAQYTSTSEDIQLEPSVTSRNTTASTTLRA